MGISATAFNIGGAIGAVALPPIAMALSWRYGFLISGAFVVAIGVLAFILYKKHPTEQKISEVRELFNRRVLKEIFANKNIILLGLAGMLFCVLEFSLITYIYRYIEYEVVLPYAVASLILGTAELSGAFAKPIFGFATDRFFHGKQNMLQIIVMAVGIGLTAVIANLSQNIQTWQIVLLSVVLGLALFGWSGLNTTLVAEFSGKARAATGVGYGFLMHNIGQIVGPPIFGYIVGKWSYQIA